MNSTVLWIFSIYGAAMLLLCLYGTVKANRKLFLSGICFFSILPIIGESTAYGTDKASVHIIVALIYVVQFILAFPNTIDYANNEAAGKLVTKIALALLIFNIGGIIYIFCLNAGVPHRFGYCHVVFALLIAYVLFKRMTTKSPLWVK